MDDNQLPYLPEIRWLEPFESPYRLRCLDVRPFTRTMTSATAGEEIANQFAKLRSETGAHLMGRQPDKAVTVDCLLRYAYNGKSGNGALFRAHSMEEKWDIFLLDGRMYFTRSWTGELIFSAVVTMAFNHVELSKLAATPQALEFGPHQAVCDVDFLVKSHIFQREAPHCIPSSLGEDVFGIAAYSYSSFGRWASFATRADTVKIPLEICPRIRADFLTAGQ